MASAGVDKKRQELLLSDLQAKKNMSVFEVADRLHVSPTTARRLCTKMANKNLVIRTYGGIRLMTANQMNYSFDQMLNEEASEKVSIAQYACQMIQDDQYVFLEAGTTLLQVAIALARRIQAGELSKLIIYTNSLSNLEVLKDVYPVNLVGGEYRPARRDFSGYISERIVRSLHFDVCFLGADAIIPEEGIMAQDLDTVQFDELLITRSTRSIIVAQSTKFARSSLISYSPLSGASCIVTDEKLPRETLQRCKARGGNIVLVPV